MVSKDDVLNVLKDVIDPEIGLNIVELNMVKGIQIRDSRVSVRITLTVAECPLAQDIRGDVEKALRNLKGVSDVNIEMSSMSKDELEELGANLQRRSEASPGAPAPKATLAEIARLDKMGIRKIVAIASGKGGVGKSFVAGMLANELRRQGYEVGVLDADVTGPSIAKIFGVTQKPVMNERGVLPVLTKTGIKVISINLLLDDPEKATIWRGPIINSVIKQLYSNVDWGDLHYLLVDLPPGTSDAPLTVFQSLPLDGVVVVTTPQDLALMVVSKAVNMARMMNVPILGLVENMGYIECPHCGKMIEPFGHVGGKDAAKRLNVPLIGVIPLDPKITELADQGRMEEYTNSASLEIGRTLRLALTRMDGEAYHVGR